MIKPLQLLLLIVALCFFQSCEKLESSHNQDEETLAKVKLEGTYAILNPLAFLNLESGFELLNNNAIAPTVKKITENTYDITWNHALVPALKGYEFKLIGNNENGDLQYVANNKVGDEGILMFIINREKGTSQLSINIKAGTAKYVASAALKK